MDLDGGLVFAGVCSTTSSSDDSESMTATRRTAMRGSTYIRHRQRPSLSTKDTIYSPAEVASRLGGPRNYDSVLAIVKGENIEMRAGIHFVMARSVQ